VNSAKAQIQLARKNIFRWRKKCRLRSLLSDAMPGNPKP
jgi:hypothetical protein